MRAVELFAGAGGLGMGISKAGFHPALVVEWDHDSCNTLRQNRSRRVAPLHKWPLPLEADIREIGFDSLEGKITLVSGGPPCQPFSLGGKHRAHADPRDMWPEAVRAVRRIRPKAFIFENVKGLTREAFAGYFNHIFLQLSYPSIARKKNENWLDHLARLQRHHTSRPANQEEYRVVFDVLNAANYGVPQRRERVVFVGFRADLGIEWSFPKATHSLDALLWSQCRTKKYWERHRTPLSRQILDAKPYARGMHLLERPSTAPWRTTRDVIGDLPDPRNANASHRLANHKYQPGARVYPGHTGSSLDEPAKTLKAGVHGVPGGENIVVLDDGSVRYLTVRESARLQTFPDKFVFCASWTESMRQLGNAVPVDLAYLLAKDIAGHLKR